MLFWLSFAVPAWKRGVRVACSVDRNDLSFPYIVCNSDLEKRTCYAQDPEIWQRGSTEV